MMKRTELIASNGASQKMVNANLRSMVCGSAGLLLSFGKPSCKSKGASALFASVNLRLTTEKFTQIIATTKCCHAVFCAKNAIWPKA